jgi:hypothetical protein
MTRIAHLTDPHGEMLCPTVDDAAAGFGPCLAMA